MGSQTYADLMRTLNAPEGSEVDERLKKLQELELLRKEREAERLQRRQQLGEGSRAGRFMRTRSTDEVNDTSSTLHHSSTFRRPLPRSDTEPFTGSYVRNDYGARPKGITSYFSEDSGSSNSEDLSDMLSKITDGIIGKSNLRRRPALLDYSSSSFMNSDRSRIYEPRSYSHNNFDDQTGSVLDDGQYGSRAQRRAARRLARQNDDANESEQDQHGEYNQTEEGLQNVTETLEHHDDNDYEEGEEPKHFIERLKNGSPVHVKRDNDYAISTIPSIPPLKKQKPIQNDGVSDLVDPMDDDILAVAKDIRATFGIKTPTSGNSQSSETHFVFNSGKENLHGNSNSSGDFVFTAETGEDNTSRQSNSKRKPRRSLRSSRENLDIDKNNMHTHVTENNDNADESVIYEIYDAEDDPEDDEGKQLPISDAFNRFGRFSTCNTPGKVDEIHEYFAGETLNGDPVIDRELDGTGVRQELEKSFTDNTKRKSKVRAGVKSPEKQQGAFSSLKSAFSNLVKFDSSESNKAGSSSDSTPEKEISEKTNDKTKRLSTQNTKKKDSGKHKAIEKVKASNRSSDSDNDSFQTASESESENRNSRRTSRASTPTTNAADISKNGGKKSQAKSDISLTLGDKLAKLETMTEEKKRKQFLTESESRRPVPSYMSGTSASQKKSRAKSPGGLIKDVRDLKKFVHDQTSETSTPVHLSRKEMMNVEQTSQISVGVKEIGIQTYINNVIPTMYVCIHCGKSSDQKVDSAISDTTTDGEDTESLDRYETRSETGYNIRSKALPKSDKQKWTFGKNENRRPPSASKTYMKGTTSSSLKNNITDSAEKVRKTSVPEITSTYNESAKSKIGKNIVAQRAKELEKAAKKGEQKRRAFSGNRSNSTDRNRNKNFSNGKSKLGKAKSVDQMYLVKSNPKQVVEIDIEKPKKDENSNDIKSCPDNNNMAVQNSALASQGDLQTRSQMLTKSTEIENQSIAKIKNEALETTKEGSMASPKAKKKPPPVSPKPKRFVGDVKTPKSPPNTDEVFETAVESKGQFTRLKNNPFIRNDHERRNSLNRGDDESVWEKSESRSTSSVESPQRDANLKKSDTSSGEKSSLTNLNWSDSGSSESLHKSKSSRYGSSHGSRSSSLHGSFESLNRSPPRPRQRSSSTTSNTVLNLLSPIGTIRNPITGALETDVDAAFVNNEENIVSDKPDSVEHNEETVDRAHLEFAKQACDLIEIDTKKRDSSSDSQNGQNKVEDSPMTNGHGKDVQMNGQANNANAKKGKQKKGFFKGKMFKK